MSNLQKLELSESRLFLTSALALLLVVAFPLAAAAGSLNGTSYSGDDPYDPAAGGFPWLYLSVDASFSGDDAYDLAAGGLPEGGTPLLASGFSGDDAYDPAAGGLAAVPLVTLAEIRAELAACELSAFTVAGGFSGDDAYDPAAGGNPGGNVVDAADAVLVACLRVGFGP